MTKALNNKTINQNRIPFIMGGFTLLELIVAIFVILTALLATTTLFQITLNLSSFSSDKLIAVYLAQEGIEIVRNIRDTNWLEARSNSNNLWDEGLNTVNCNTGCEVDYTTLLDLDPDPPAFGSGRFLNIDADGFYSYEPETPTKFKRKITITPLTIDTLKVEVEVSWTERERDHNFSVQENLYNWQ